jgi:uncharacterized protein (TIGR02145 family)
MSGCDKTTYAGGATDNFNADCRNATNGFDGHYFSWCFVMRFADELCPGDWRVPTSTDFGRLNSNLVYPSMPWGSFNHGITDDPNTWTYMGNVGTGSAAILRTGTWGGARFTGTAGAPTTSTTHYWSSTEARGYFGTIETNAHSLQLQATIAIWAHESNKSSGFALRCIWGGDPSLIVGVPATLSACAPSSVEIPITRGTGATIYRSNANSTDINIVVTGNSFTATASGTYLFRARIGDEWGPISQTVVAIHPNVTIPAGAENRPSTTERVAEIHPTEKFPNALTVNPTGGGTILAYRWYSNTTNGATGWTFVEETTTNEFFPPRNEWGSLFYRVTVVATCGTVNSNVSGRHIVTLQACNNHPLNPTTFPTGLGTQSFATNQTWTVGTGANIQAWSDAVTMSGCDKPTYTPGFSPNFNADCRVLANDFDGHHFSWCMVFRFDTVLCPAPWRVPTSAEFVTLHANLGSPTDPAGTYMAATSDTVNRGGIWGGARFTATTDANPAETNSYYWSSTPVTTAQARGLHYRGEPFSQTDLTLIYAPHSTAKQASLALRCIWGGDQNLIITTPSSTVTNCGPATIPVTAGTGVRIFVQTAADGTSDATEVTGGNFVANTSGTYYFRARNVANEWGPAQRVVVTIIPAGAGL